MPSGKKIDWSQLDDLLRQNLPNMTIASWILYYAPNISAKAAGARARKLGIIPMAYRPTEEHKKSISKAILKETPQMVQFVRNKIDIYSRQELAKLIGLSPARLSDLINRHNIELSEKGRKRAAESTRQAHLGKIPWNKGHNLSNETKAKISRAVSGTRNGQYGRGMTEREKTRWRQTYFANGINRMRSWLTSAREKGYYKYRGTRTTLDTRKGGKFTTRSSYETRYVGILEADVEVMQFLYEPFTIAYQYDGRDRNYTPDFLIEYADGHEELVEVKPSKFVNLSINLSKKLAAEDCGAMVRIITEIDIGEMECHRV